MSRYDAESDLDYTDEPWADRGIELHCIDCGAVVYVSRGEPYPGPALRCETCAEKPVEQQKRGAA